jgi:hypothetical protein
MPPDDLDQLDLFAHSRDVMLCNDAVDALLRRDPAASAATRRALADFVPGHDAQPPLQSLGDALAANHGAAFADLAEADAARQHLAHSVAPAAQTLLRQSATPWLAPLWRQLAERAAALPFRAAHTEAHAAALWLQAGDAAAAIRAVQGIESWRRIPAPLAWMAQARHAADGLDAAWPLLVELAWLAPAWLAICARAIADPLLDRLVRRFDIEQAAHEGDAPAGTPLAWFPAWLLNDQPALAPRLRQAQVALDTEPERAFRLMGELLGLERAGRHAELIDARKRLRSLQPALYAIYLRTR